MLDRRVNEMPKQGKVVIAHPDKEWPAKMLAASEDLRYFLSGYCSSTCVYVMDLDALDYSLDLSVLKGVWA